MIFTNDLMVLLSYSHTNDGYQLQRVVDAGVGGMCSSFKHFVDGANSTTEYTYDVGGKMLFDVNRTIRYI